MAALGFREPPSSARQFQDVQKVLGLAGIRVGITVLGWSVTHANIRGRDDRGRGRGGGGGKVKGASGAGGRAKGAAGVRPCD